MSTLAQRLFLLASKFSTDRYLRTDEEGKGYLREHAQGIKQMVREMAAKMTPETCTKLFIDNPKPLGAGLNGFVFESTKPGIVIKAAFDLNDVIMAEKVIQMEKGLDCLPEVYKVMKNVRLYDGARGVHLIYLERLRPLPIKVAKALETMLNDVILDDGHHAKRYTPAQYMKAVQTVVAKAPKGSTMQKVAQQLLHIMQEMADQSWWHLDLHSENFCLSGDGQRLKLIDLGALLDPTEVQRFWGPIAFPQQSAQPQQKAAFTQKHRS